MFSSMLDFLPNSSKHLVHMPSLSKVSMRPSLLAACGPCCLANWERRAASFRVSTRRRSRGPTRFFKCVPCAGVPLLYQRGRCLRTPACCVRLFSVVLIGNSRPPAVDLSPSETEPRASRSVTGLHQRHGKQGPFRGGCRAQVAGLIARCYASACQIAVYAQKQSLVRGHAATKRHKTMVAYILPHKVLAPKKTKS